LYIQFINYQGCRHPVQLYASAGLFILFLFLFTLKRLNKFRPGFIFWSYLFLISSGRFLLDFIRQDTIYLGLKAGQWLSIPVIAISLYALIKYHKKDLVSS